MLRRVACSEGDSAGEISANSELCGSPFWRDEGGNPQLQPPGAKAGKRMAGKLENRRAKPDEKSKTCHVCTVKTDPSQMPVRETENISFTMYKSAFFKLVDVSNSAKLRLGSAFGRKEGRSLSCRGTGASRPLVPRARVRT